MIAELYIENKRADITADLPSLLNFAIDDVKNFGERSTTWSKTIKLPGTKTNNKLLGNIFQIGQANEYSSLLANIGYNFNAAKSASCLMFQDNIQAFIGDMRLLQINIDNGTIEYEVAVFGTLFSLNVALSGAFLDDLDFSEYNHTFNETEVVTSWDNTPGSGYYYPLIDFGNYSTNKHDWDIRTFRPALYVKEYIDKIFTAAGFEYNSDLFETDRFKRLIIPPNKKSLLVLTTPYFNAYRNTVQNNIVVGSTVVGNVIFNAFTDVGFSIDGGNEVITYDSPTTSTFNISLSYSLQMVNAVFFSSQNFYVDILLNGAVINTQTYTVPAFATPIENRTVNITQTLAQNDTLNVRVRKDSISGSVGASLLSASFTASTDDLTYNQIEVGDDININDTIPKNIRQIDFLVSIVKLFNIYVYGDRFNDRLIYFKPYIDFYSTDPTDAVDWTYKMDRNKRRTIKPMSELNSKIYMFKFKGDSDYYNDLYNKRYGESYGSLTFDTQYEFAAETNSLELIFAATVLVGYAGEDKIYPTIFKRTGADSDPVEENVDSIIRIMQTKKLSASSWNIKDGATVLDTVTEYGYAGHFDDPTDPSNDLNFGALNELFFSLTTGTLSVTQFNVYWSSYMAEITDKDSKLLSADFYLRPKDIFDLDFAKYVNVDGVLFRLNKISDYNTNNPDTCKVELLKVINTKY